MIRTIPAALSSCRNSRSRDRARDIGSSFYLYKKGHPAIARGRRVSLIWRQGSPLDEGLAQIAAVMRRAAENSLR